MRKTALLLASMALAVVLASGVALAAAGDFDRTFSKDGKVITGVDPGYLDRIEDLAVLPSGKIIAFGRSFYDNVVVARYLPDGSLDESFGGGDGIVTSGRISGQAAVVQADGKLVVAGKGYKGFARRKDVGLIRFDPDGTLDESFGGGDGKVLTDLGGGTDDIAYALSVQKGKLVVAANISQPSAPVDTDIGLVRYSSDGNLDESFGEGGIVKTDLRGHDEAYDLAVQKDGKLVVAGTSYAGSSNDSDSARKVAVVRYRPGGAVDETFSGGDRFPGAVLTSFGEGSYARALVLLGGGRLVVAGSGAPAADNIYRFGLAAYDSDGSLDETFGGGDGKVTTGFRLGTNQPVNAYAIDLARGRDGKLVAVGATEEEDGNRYRNFALVRYLPSGRLDKGFGGRDGKVSDFFDRETSNYDAALAVAIQPDGKIVAGGYTGFQRFRFALARLQGE